MAVSRAASSLLSVGDIEEMLKDQVESLVQEIFPNAMKEGHEMCVGSIAGDKGQSLRINIGNGPKRGWWKDFSGTEKGDALKLIAAALFGGDIRKAVAWAKSWLRLDDEDPDRIKRHQLEVRARSAERSKAAADEKRKGQERARARWHQGVPIAGTIVEDYLRGRAIDFRALGKAPGALRFHAGLAYGFQGPIVPAMVAMITNLAGEHIATHRTWLRADGSDKAGADLLGLDRRGLPNDPKKVMGGYWGGHIPIWKGAHPQPLRDIPPGTDVYSGEGIEDTATCALEMPDARFICHISVGNLEALELPPQMGRLIVLAQNDAPGSDADRMFKRAIARQRSQGRRVELRAPPADFKDWNDLARGIRMKVQS